MTVASLSTGSTLTHSAWPINDDDHDNSAGRGCGGHQGNSESGPGVAPSQRDGAPGRPGPGAPDAKLLLVRPPVKVTVTVAIRVNLSGSAQAE